MVSTKASLRCLALIALGCGLLAPAWAQLNFDQSRVAGAVTAGSQFGFSVAMSIDGNTAIVGAPGFNSSGGGAWIYRRTSGIWDGGTQLTAGTGAAGAGQQGYAVGISGDGLTAIVGAPFDTAAGANAGAFWIYASSAGTFTQQGAIHSGATGNQLGYSVALSADGNTAIIGAPVNKSAVVWVRSGTTWTLQTTLMAGGTTSLGAAVSISADGNTALVGDPDASGAVGAAWAFTQSGGVWSDGTQLPLGTPAISAGRQGLAVALSGNGQRAVVGGDNTALAGAAWVFNLSNGVWTQEGELAQLSTSGTDAQGSAVAITAEGNFAMTGAYNYLGGGGAVIQYVRQVNPSTQQVTWGFLFLEFGTAPWQAGRSVALSSLAGTAGVAGFPGYPDTGVVFFSDQPDMAITNVHNGTFTRGQVGATYTIHVSNVGSASTIHPVTVTVKIPTGLTATGPSGTVSGWSCTIGAILTCTRPDSLAAGSAYPDITLTVNVAQSAPPAIANTATVSGGGELNAGNDTSTDLVTVPQVADLAITKTHTGALAAGAVVTYTIGVKNAGTVSTSGTVTVTDTLPGGLSSPILTSSSGWSPCSFAGTLLTCSRGNALAGGAAYPAIAYTATVSGSVGATINNTATVSCACDTNAANNSSTDSATLTGAGPDLSISESHSGNFVRGQGNSYTITVRNVGSGPTAGQVMVLDTLPAGLNIISMSGTGWTCATFLATCVRADPLAAGASYPTIRVALSVASNSPASVTNVATVSGGGDVNAANNSLSDLTAVQ